MKNPRPCRTADLPVMEDLAARFVDPIRWGDATQSNQGRSVCSVCRDIYRTSVYGALDFMQQHGGIGVSG